MIPLGLIARLQSALEYAERFRQWDVLEGRTPLQVEAAAYAYLRTAVRTIIEATLTS